MPRYVQKNYDDFPFSVAHIGNHWDQEPVSRQYGIPLFHWLQTEKGCGIVKIESEERKLAEGEGFLIAPNIPHSYKSCESAWFTSFVVFGGFLKDGIEKMIGNTPYQFIDAQRGQYFAEWITTMIENFESNTYVSINASVACYDFLMHFSPLHKSHTIYTHPLYKQYVEPTIKSIEEHYAEPLSVQNLASAMYVTPQYLTRLFQRFLGYSVHAYMIKCRIDNAKKIIIMKPHANIQYIANLVGYNDTSNFIAAFKKNTGYTPDEFRRRHL
ncbi:MAG: AraC family transcriptional regulator [Ruminococcaceae bacterium]|nr:AraC family transcriptional regulator [Oscillospiraceae bacterium]